ncbi:MAG: NADH-quinone oxidoreductase subunit A [Planctomycetota bacterium]
MTDLVGHFLLFTLVGIAFLLAPLLLGWLVRPTNPTAEKLAAYECGEPAIGSSYVQFDMRFYVVALLFIIFDVEVAFFFPWAMIYGGAMQLADHRLESAARMQISERMLNVPAGSLPVDQIITAETAYHLGLTGLFDILVFFGVLLVGFAYVWKRGDLDWVRAMAQESQQRRQAAAEASLKA